MQELYQYLTETEVSQMTRIAVQTLRNDRFNRRGIPSHKIGASGKSVRYKLTDVLAYMEAGNHHHRNHQDPRSQRWREIGVVNMSDQQGVSVSEMVREFINQRMPSKSRTI